MADGYGYGTGFGTEIGNLCKYIGQTVTIFTASGGVSGCGFTGVLMSATDCYVRLLTCIGSAPSCPVGSACCPGVPTCAPGGYPAPGIAAGVYGGCGDGCGSGAGYAANFAIGSVVVIPVDKIVSFSHNAI